jgi:hypothetical protein
MTLWLDGALLLTLAGNIVGTATAWRSWRRAARLNAMLNDCVMRSWAMRHGPTFKLWSDTMGRDVIVETRLRPRAEHDREAAPE